MKKAIVFLLAAAAVVLSGCGAGRQSDRPAEAAKLSKVEVFSAGDQQLVATITDQDTIKELFAATEWEQADGIPAGLEPERTFAVYQQKTLLHGQDPDAEREYERIQTFTTFRDSDYIKEVVSDQVVKNIKLREEDFTFYFLLPEAIADQLSGF